MEAARGKTCLLYPPGFPPASSSSSSRGIKHSLENPNNRHRTCTFQRLRIPVPFTFAESSPAISLTLRYFLRSDRHSYRATFSRAFAFQTNFRVISVYSFNEILEFRRKIQLCVFEDSWTGGSWLGTFTKEELPLIRDSPAPSVTRIFSEIRRDRSR